MTPAEEILTARDSLAAAHYYLYRAREAFYAATDGTDPHTPMTPEENQLFEAVYDAEQTALDAAEVFLEVLHGCSCEGLENMPPLTIPSPASGVETSSHKN